MNLKRYEDYVLHQTRRAFLGRTAMGVGTAALTNLISPLFSRGADATPGRTVERWKGILEKPHFPAKAKRVIFLTMAGGASHLETFDYKPKLAEMHGKPMPDSITVGQPIAQLQGAKLTCFGPQHTFNKCGQSGQNISSVFKKFPDVADEVCIINSLKTDAINHDPAHTLMNTGSSIPGRPSMGSWTLYGLGSETDNLPGFVVMTSHGKFGQSQPIAARQWHSGFLPSNLQGVEFRSKGEAVLYVNNPNGINNNQQRDVVSAAQQLNQLLDGTDHDPEILTRISQYEMAFRMQNSIPELTDFSNEPRHVLDLYGTKGGDGSFSANCLLARRMAERGVRFIQLYHRDWDHHGGIKEHIRGTAEEVDQGMTALIKDLKQRGMLSETLIVWTPEFGRTPMAQGDGRDHHIKGFSGWMCGGGVKGGITYGETDEFGYNAVKDVVHVHDLHATMQHLLGIDHERLTFPFSGRLMRLTDIFGTVVKGILA